MPSSPILPSLILGLATLAPLAAQQLRGPNELPAIGGVVPPPNAASLMTLAEVSRLGFSVQGAGARSTGMGGAFIAVADDGTAASHNPAGLAQLRLFETSLVTSSHNPDLDYTGATPVIPGNVSVAGANTYKGSASRKVEFVSFTAPATVGGRNLVVQVSWQNLFDMDLSMDHSRSIFDPSTPQTTNLKEGIRQKGRISTITGSVAYEFSPRILAGVSYNRWSGNWSYTSDYTFSTSLPTTQEGTVRTASTFDGQNYNLGLLWRSEDVKVGLTYRTPFTATFAVNGGIYAPNTEPSMATPENMRVHWPWTLGAGIAWRLTAPFQVTLDWSRTPWSKTTFEAPGNELDQRNFFSPFVTLTSINPRRASAPLPTADATSWHLGGEYLFFWGSRILPVRVGMFREPQPSLDARTGEQRSLKGLTFGFGLKQGALSFDLAFKHATGERNASIPEDPQTGFAFIGAGSYDDYYSWTGREKVTVNQVKASVIWQFKGEGLRSFFRSLFIGQ